MINHSNEVYRRKGLALIQKIPTPITPVEMNKSRGQITLAYFDQKSTVDYIGAVQGIPVCFDAKECKTDTFPLHNIHEHQVSFMHDFVSQGGVAFLIIHFTERDEIYYLSFSSLDVYWHRMLAGGRKSFTYDEIDKSRRIGKSGDVLVHYLPEIQKEIG